MYCNRIGTYLPVAIAIKLFGFDGYLLTWVTVCELVLLLACVYLALWKYNKGVALLACALLGFSPAFLELSGTLYGDVMTALTSNLCILWIWRMRHVAPHSNQIFGGIMLAALWYYALLTKESALYFLLPIFIFFIEDKRNGRLKTFWNTAIFTGIAIGVSVLLIYQLKTGNALHRLSAIEFGPNINIDNYSRSSWTVLLTRVTVLPLKFMIEVFTFFMVFLPGVMQALSKSENAQESFFKKYMVSLCVMWWLGTQSFRTWSPILLIDRLWLPLLVPMAINAAHVLWNLKQGKQKRYATIPIGIFIIMMTILIPVSGMDSVVRSAYMLSMKEFVLIRVWLPVVIFMVIFYGNFLKTARDVLFEMLDNVLIIIGWIIKLPKYFLSVALILLLALVWFHLHTLKWKDPRQNSFLDERQMIDFVRKANQPAVILTENCVSRNHGIYYGFDSLVEKQLDFVDWSLVDSVKLKELAARQSVYLLIAKERIAWYAENDSIATKLYPQFNYDLKYLPDFVLSPDSNWNLVKSNARSTLYKYSH